MKTWFLAVLFVVVGPIGAQASLVGDNVTLNNVLGCNPCTADVVEGGAPEFFFQSDFISVNVEASSFTIALEPPVGSVRFGFTQILTLSSLDWLNDPTGRITGLDITNNGVENLTESDFSFTDHSVMIDLGSTFWVRPNENDNVHVGLQTTHAPVPTPSAMLLMGTGLLGLIGYRKWSSKNS